MVNLIKTKAVFEILLIITSIFFISSFSVSAQEDSASKSCCERTNSGENCVYTDSSNCDAHYKKASRECSSTTFCEVGCCFNADGTCSNAASKSTCDSKSGLFNKNINCKNVPLCNNGCCVIGDNYFLSTKQQCQEKKNLYPNLKMEFNADITDEATCIRQVQNKEMGCCIQGTECTYTDRGSCLGESESEESTKPNSQSSTPPTGMATAVPKDSSSASSQESSQAANSQQQDSSLIFESGKFCSQAPLCGCKKKHHKQCYEGDVYWYDSCSNREDIAQDCDYSKGTLCNSKTFKCESLNCPTTIDKKSINSNDIVSYDGIRRLHGESWCEYDGAVGFGQDLVGSRHYRHLCIAGEEIIEPCKDYREEYCLQAKGIIGSSTILEAACKPNNWKECATTCNTAKDKKTDGQLRLAMQRDRTCCEDPLKSCFWSAASDEKIKKVNADYQKDLASTCSNLKSDDPACQPDDYNIADPGYGICLPLVPPGLKFWTGEKESSEENQPEEDAKEVCGVGTKTCNVFYYSNIVETSGHWYIVNDQCTKPDFAINSQAYCKSLGDCGVHYNIAGKFSNLAYDCETTEGKCVGSKNGFAYDLLHINWESVLGGFDSYTKAKPLQTEDFDLSGHAGMGSIDNPYGLTNLLISSIGGASAAIITGIAIAVESTLLTGIGVGLGGLIMITILIMQLTAKTDQMDVAVYCNPWVPPYGSKDCEKCTNEEILKKLNYNTCSEYKCKSLGQNCKWLAENEGSNRSSCISTNINDVNAPKIKPWPEALTKNYKLTEFTNGYKIDPSPEGYALITFGIITDEPSQCKYASEPNIKYDDMPSNFGDVFIETLHKLTISAIPNKPNNVYIKCKDGNGNANNIDYLVKFTAKGGKDFTPPIILSASIKNNAVISSGSTPVSIYVNEPADCRYSAKNILYDQMENGMVCNGNNAVVNSDSKFICTGNFNINEGANSFYFKCKDLKGNINQESYMLTLSGSPALSITSTSPSGDIDTNLITIGVTTSGGANSGVANCIYILNGASYQFNQTSSSSHSTELPQLPIGSYNIPISCKDELENTAEAVIAFSITKDITPPTIMFIYSQSETLTITTDEPSVCEYSEKDFSYGTGKKMDGIGKDHTLAIEKNKYVIICSDQYENKGNPFIVYP